MKYIFLGLTFCFCHFIAHGQQSKIDSLQNVLKIATDETILINTRHHLYQILIDEAERKYYNDKEFQQSAQLFEQAFALEARKNESHNFYNAACSWALAGNKANAFKNLNKAIDNGGIELQWLKDDKDLANLHGEKEWSALLGKLQIQIDRGKINYYWGVFFGILFILFFYNLFLFFSLKEFSFLYYSLFLFIYANAEITRTQEFGIYLTDMFFWIKYMKPMSGFPLFGICFMTIFYLLFVKDFLYLKQNSIILDKYFKILILFFIILTIASYYFFLFPIFTLAPLVLIGFIFPLGIGFYLWIKKYKPARLFVLANVFFVMGAVGFLLEMYKLINFESFIFHADNIGSVAFFALLSFAIGDKINILKKEKVEAQEKALEVLEEKVIERTEEVTRQKKLVDEKNKDITDSIRYAKGIQQALLPSEEEFASLLPNSFVLFRPKDIVSGDFHWLTEKDNKVYFVAADCTGHGVPGGFMSMISSALLTEAVNEKGLTAPNEIFEDVRKGLINALKQTGEFGQQKDGMDAVLCSWDRKDTLEFAAAYNPFILIRDGELIETKPDKMPVGFHAGQQGPFTNHKLKVKKNDMVYIFSDGYQDQFGGPKGKKFMIKRMKELLVEIHLKMMTEQKEILEKKLEEWMGSTEQVDDILVIGVRF